MREDAIVYFGTVKSISLNKEVLDRGAFIFAQDNYALKIADGSTKTKDLAYLPYSTITQTDITNWRKLLVDYYGTTPITNETDPTVSAAIKAITPTQITHWDTAYSWGNHSTVGYLLNETDPTVPAVVKTISALDIFDWDTAVSWGNHAIQGYLTSADLSGYLLATTAAATYSPLGHTHTFASITGKPTTLVGYGITDAYPLSGNPSGFLTSITSGQITTALGFTPYDATNPSSYITSAALTPYLTITAATATYSPLGHTHAFSSLSGIPTTLAGYGITDGALKTTTITIQGSAQDISANRTFSIDKPLTFITYNSDGSTVIATGSKKLTAIIVNKACTITKWFMLSDINTTATIDIWRANAAYPTSNAQSIIGAGTKPSLTASLYNTNTPTSWTSVALVVGDIIIIEVTANSLATYLELKLECTS